MPETWYSPYPVTLRGLDKALDNLDNLDNDLKHMESIVSICSTSPLCAFRVL